MGAWIETDSLKKLNWQYKVASYVGAWIETKSDDLVKFHQIQSHPTWVRGLKLDQILSQQGRK